MKEKTYNIMKKIQGALMSDVSFHLIYSFVLCIVTAIFFPLSRAAILTMLIGILKEAVDKYTYNLWSWRDLGADLAGVTLAVMVRILIAG